MQFKALPLAVLPALASATQFNVTVGANNQFVFNPSTVTAQVGDIVVFTITGNHTVTQVPFENPCSSSAQGFDSGFLAAAATGSTTVQITVNDTNPIWLKCSQELPGNHCSLGMVAAINPPASGNNTFQAYQTAATGSCQAAPSTTSSSGGPSYGGYFACIPVTKSTGAASTTKVGVFGLLSAAVLAAATLL